MKKSKTNKTKKILIIEGFLIFGILIYLFFSTSPNSIYPFSGMTISENNFSFEIENGYEILISKTSDFENAFVFKEGDSVTLPPGLYYWKVRNNFRESDVKNFTIESTIGLDFYEREENYELENSGNVDINITKKNNDSTSSEILDVGESAKYEKDNSTYEGRQI